MNKTLFPLFVICTFFCSVACETKPTPKKIGELIGREKVDLEWMISESNVYLPESSTRLDYTPYIEYGKLFKFKIDRIEIENVILQNELQPIQTLRNKFLLIADLEKDWFRRNLDSLGNKKYFYNNNCRTGILWRLLIEQTEGTLWFEVIHADAGGDLPDCNNDNQLID